MQLPDRWTGEDVEFLLEELDKGYVILLAGTELGIPTIHEQRGEGWEAKHCGFGLFHVDVPDKVEVDELGVETVIPGFEYFFDAGGAMARTPGGRGYTRVEVKRGEIPNYDIEAVWAKLESWLELAFEEEVS